MIEDVKKGGEGDSLSQLNSVEVVRAKHTKQK